MLSVEPSLTLPLVLSSMFAPLLGSTRARWPQKLQAHTSSGSSSTEKYRASQYWLHVRQSGSFPPVGLVAEGSGGQEAISRATCQL